MNNGNGGMSPHAYNRAHNALSHQPTVRQVRNTVDAMLSGEVSHPFGGPLWRFVLHALALLETVWDGYNMPPKEFAEINYLIEASISGLAAYPGSVTHQHEKEGPVTASCANRAARHAEAAKNAETYKDKHALLGLIWSETFKGSSHVGANIMVDAIGARAEAGSAEAVERLDQLKWLALVQLKLLKIAGINVEMRLLHNEL